MSIEPGGTNFIFTQETIDSLIALGEVLKRNLVEIRKDGYDIIDGKIIHIESGKEYDPTKQRV